MDPVVAKVGLAWHQELVRLGGYQGIALLIGEAEAHGLLVPGERQEHDPADAELHPVPDERLGGAGELAGNGPRVLDRHHEPSWPHATDIPTICLAGVGKAWRGGPHRGRDRARVIIDAGGTACV